MHQYEVTEVNCPFRCFSLSVRCINTRAITLYGWYFVSQSTVTFICLYNLLIWSNFPVLANLATYIMEKERLKAWRHTITKYVKVCLHCAVRIIRGSTRNPYNIGDNFEKGRMNSFKKKKKENVANYSRLMLRSNQPEVWGIQKSHHLLLSHLIYSRELPWLSQIAVDTFWCNVANYCLIFWTSLAKSYKLCFMRPIGWWSEQLRTDGVCWTSSKYEHALAWHSFFDWNFL